MIVRENKSMQTLKRYMEGIQEFTKFLGAKNPDEALEIFSNIEDRTSKLDEFIDYMIENKKSPIDIKAKWHGVKKWLISNRINNIDWDYISKPKAISQIQDRIPTVEELRLILDNRVSLRDKAFFLVVASAGFRLGTAMTLKVKDYAPIEDLGIITVEGGEGRKLATGKKYFTFITPEARRFLEEYLKTRQPLTDDAPLFACESKSQGKVYGFSSNASRQWTILVRKAKLLEKAPSGRNFTLHGHSLRKFFQTHCKLAGCRADFVDFWMGHHPQGQNQYLNDSYFRPELKHHIHEYRKAISHLQVFDLYNAGIQEQISQMKSQYDYIIKWIKSNDTKDLPDDEQILEPSKDERQVLKQIHTSKYAPEEVIDPTEKDLEGENEFLRERLDDVSAQLKELKRLVRSTQKNEPYKCL
jgi:integrase